MTFRNQELFELFQEVPIRPKAMMSAWDSAKHCVIDIHKSVWRLTIQYKNHLDSYKIMFSFKQIKDTVKIPLDLRESQYYTETGYRFSLNVTAFYISFEE